MNLPSRFVLLDATVVRIVLLPRGELSRLGQAGRAAPEKLSATISRSFGRWVPSR